jgi:hypothetical protein
LTAAGECASPAPGPDRVAAGERNLHLLVLALCLGLIGAALVLDPADPARPAGGAITFAGHHLPEVCAFKRVTGLPCPGCGLTRSWVAAVHGDLAASLAFHRLGWLVLLYVALQALRHAAWLALARRRQGIERSGRWLDRGIIPLGVVLLIAWVPTLLAALG